VTVAAKSEQFTEDETGKGQFFWGNRRNLAEEEDVYLAITHHNIRETYEKGETYEKDFQSCLPIDSPVENRKGEITFRGSCLVRSWNCLCLHFNGHM